MSVIVSLVPPFVHCGALESADAPPDAAPEVMATLELDPADTAVVPAEPGPAVCRSAVIPAGR